MKLRISVLLEKDWSTITSRETTYNDISETPFSFVLELNDLAKPAAAAVSAQIRAIAEQLRKDKTLIPANEETTTEPSTEQE